MKTDSLFYKLFQVLPETLFELLGESSQRARDYQFTSIEVKQTSKTIDGVFTTDNKELKIYFVEVQFQKDEDLYYRLISEITTYIGQFKPKQPWQGVVLWARRSIESNIPLEYEFFFNQNLIEIIYLDEIEPNSLALGIIDLVVGSPKDTTAQKVQLLTTSTKETVGDSTLQRDIIELIERVIIYKFPQKSNKELEEMFGLAEWKETQFYKDVKLEGIKEGKLEGIKEGKLETIPLLVKLGLSPEQIAKELDIDLEIVKQEISKY